MKYVLVFIFLLIIIFSALNIQRVIYSKKNHRETPSATPTLSIQSPTPTYENEIIETQAIWSLIQDWRKSQSYEPYLEDSRLCDLAETRIEEIALNNNHTGFWEHSKDFYHNGLAENISSGWLYEKQMLDAWLKSPSHKKNLDAPYIYSCLRCEDNRCVQIFGNF